MPVPKILIITYAYPPATLIAGRRPLTWGRHLAAAGFDVTVLTRHWEGLEKKQEEVDASNLRPQSETMEEGVRVIRLPFENAAYLANLRKPLHRRVHIAAANAAFYNTPSNPYNFSALKTFLESHLPGNRYDMVIVTTPPSQYLKLGHWINKKFGIPFWADFRDYLFLFDTAANTLQQTGGLKKTILQHYLRQTRKYLSAASIVSAVSQPIITDLELRHAFDEYLILNGFEAADAPPEKAAPVHTEQFTISILGTIYPKQDIGFMLRGFQEFVRGKEDRVAINFIGTGSDENVRKQIEAAIQIPGLRVTGWVARSEAMATIAGSNVLYYIGWNNLKGIYSGKIFEYLGAARNILVAPNDHDVVEALLKDTNAGKLADTPAEMTAILNAWYEEWQQQGHIAYAADPARVAAYSREAQAGRVAEILRGYFSSKPSQS